MKNVEVLSINQVVQSIPTQIDTRTLSTEDKAQLIILKYHFQKAADTFENEMQELIKSLKPEGFDELAQKVQQAEEAKEKQLEEAKKVLDTKESFNEGAKGTATGTLAGSKDTPDIPTVSDEEQSKYDEQLATLNKEYNAARMKRLMEECDTPRHIPYTLFTALVAFIGDSSIKLSEEQKISSTQALFMLAALLEDKQ